MIETVAVGTDGSRTAEQAVEAALDLAERFGARIVFLSAYGDGRGVPTGASHVEQWLLHPADDVDDTLARAEEHAARRGVAATSAAAHGDPGDVLVRLAEQHGADVLVVGSQGMQRRLLGSVPNTVSHKAPCSVFIVRTS